MLSVPQPDKMMEFYISSCYGCDVMEIYEETFQYKYNQRMEQGTVYNY